ncbi:MAG: transcription elongation factor GreA [Actinobacteria bacterium]|jgi:transcription elongation factor GreA|nr:transcription elongation factor GreA [Actinomycetota bacterium]
MTTQETWLTQEAYDRLSAELSERAGAIRDEIKNRIAQAREEGDLKENGGYHAAREEQGKNEARINELSHLLEHAKIGRPEVEEGVVSHGMIITVHYGDEKPDAFLLGIREEAATTSHTVYSPGSPMGQAIMGTRVGETVEYTAPNGKVLRVTIMDVTPHN